MANLGKIVAGATKKAEAYKVDAQPMQTKQGVTGEFTFNTQERYTISRMKLGNVETSDGIIIKAAYLENIYLLDEEGKEFVFNAAPNTRIWCSRNINERYENGEVLTSKDMALAYGNTTNEEGIAAFTGYKIILAGAPAPIIDEEWV
jgi:hypothetical protein